MAKQLDEALFWMALSGKKLSAVQALVKSKLFHQEPGVTALLGKLQELVVLAAAEDAARQAKNRNDLKNSEGETVGEEDGTEKEIEGPGRSPGPGDSAPRPLSRSEDCEGEDSPPTAIKVLHQIGEKNLFRLLQLGRTYLAATWCLLCREEYAQSETLTGLKPGAYWTTDLKDILCRRTKGGPELWELVEKVRPADSHPPPGREQS